MPDAMTTPPTQPPTEAEFADAYAWMLRHVAVWGRGRGEDIREAAHDAATLGLVWARDNYRPHLGRFGAFAQKAVRVSVSRAVTKWRDKYHGRPPHLSLDAELDGGGEEVGMRKLSDLLADPRSAGVGEPDVSVDIRDLPAELRDAVRLYYIDRFRMSDIGLMTGTSTDTVRRRLVRAAKILGQGLAPRAARYDEKLFTR